MKLLIADDDLTSRAILAAVAKKWGYLPELAEDGERAWEILQQPEPPVLMLIDWEMPNMNGLELCQKIRQQSTDNPPFIILLTARNSTEDVVLGLETGANDYIAKPFANAELQARLQVGQRMLELQQQVKKANDVLTFEREVIENIILKMRASKSFAFDNLRMLDQPVEKTSGDIMLSAFRPDKVRHIMMGDFTGHGLMAALGGPIVCDIFYTMTAKNIPMSEISNEMNRQLLQKMPTGLFLGAVFMEINAEGKELSLWNCGMSDVLIYRDAQLDQRFCSNLMALGIIEQDFSEIINVKIQSDDRIYAYSDGITEVINSEEEELGQQRFEELLTKMLKTNADMDFLSQTVLEFRGEADQFDDITLLELTC